MLCSTPKFLARVASSIPSGHALRPYVAAAIATRTSPAPAFRTLDELRTPTQVPTYAELADLPQARLLSVANCHNGQLKLTLSVLEFIALSLTKLGAAQRDVLVVYAGASGLASVAAATAFPDVRFWLYDPAPNTVKLMPPFADRAIVRRRDAADAAVPDARLVVFTDQAGWFTDDVARQVRRVARSDASPSPTRARKHVLFISDIRAENVEASIAMDMRRQARWALLLGASMYMFKFRIPFIGPDNQDAILAVYHDTDAIARDTGARLVGPPTSAAKSSRRRRSHEDQTTFPYLAGDLHLQVSGPPHSTELRLIGARRADGAYDLRAYSIPEIEGKMALFNAVHRSHASYKFGSVVGDYDRVSEAVILTRCVRARLGKAPSKTDVEDVHRVVHAAISRFIQKDASSCALVTAAKRADRVLKDPELRAFLMACHAKVASTLPPHVDAQIRRGLRLDLT